MASGQEKVFWPLVIYEMYKSDKPPRNPLLIKVEFFPSLSNIEHTMKRSGFTLLEIIITTAIIALIVSISIPVLRAARQKARAVVCASNVRQLSLALTIYEQENKTFPRGFDDTMLGTLIPPDGYPGTPTYDLEGLWWFHFLENILKEQSTLWCPSRHIKGPSVNNNILCGNYGVNRSICKDARGLVGSEFVGQPLGLAHIRQPAKTLLIIDSGYSLISWCGAANICDLIYENQKRENVFYVPGLSINQERLLLPGCEGDAIGGRHPGKRVNVAFADGAIDTVEANDLYVEKLDGAYQNLVPLWIPD